MKKLVIFRGVPSSGKSYQAKLLAPSTKHIFSTDEYYTGTNPGVTKPGGYIENWTGQKIAAAHGWNLGRCHTAMTFGITPILIDNTNIKREHAAIYGKMAREFGYEVDIQESRTPWWLEIRVLLADKTANGLALMSWAKKLSQGFHCNGNYIPPNEHGVPESSIYNMLMNFENYTVEDITR